MKLFKPEDFGGAYENQYTARLDAIGVTDIANTKLQEWLDAAPTVYGTIDISEPKFWGEKKFGSDTHSAKLVCLEEIKKECTEHEVVNVCIEGALIRAVCKHCGAELKATWKAVK